MSGWAGDDPRVGTTRSRALCNTCGTLRLVGHNYYGRDKITVDDLPLWSRNMVSIRCATCKAVTWHARLNDDPKNAEFRDITEEGQAEPWRFEYDLADLRELIDRMRDHFGVVFEFGHADEGQSDEVDTTDPAILVAWRSSDHWNIRLSQVAPVHMQLVYLRKVWHDITHDEFGAIDFDPYTGVGYLSNQHYYTEAIDQGLQDFKRWAPAVLDLIELDRREATKRMLLDVAAILEEGVQDPHTP